MNLRSNCYYYCCHFSITPTSIPTCIIFGADHLHGVQRHRQRVHHPVGAPDGQEMSGAVHRNRYLAGVPAYRFHWTVWRPKSVNILDKIDAVLYVRVICVAGHNADRMDSRQRSVPDEVRLLMLFVLTYMCTYLRYTVLLDLEENNSWD